jgi:hypothetical protein
MAVQHYLHACGAVIVNGFRKFQRLFFSLEYRLAKRRARLSTVPSPVIFPSLASCLAAPNALLVPARIIASIFGNSLRSNAA